MHLTVNETKQKISCTEFLLWQKYFEDEDKRIKKEDIYLAQIAAEVRRSWIGTPNAVKVETFYVRPEKRKKGIETYKMSPEERNKVSQSVWKAWANMNSKNGIKYV